MTKPTATEILDLWLDIEKTLRGIEEITYPLKNSRNSLKYLNYYTNAIDVCYEDGELTFEERKNLAKEVVDTYWNVVDNFNA